MLNTDTETELRQNFVAQNSAAVESDSEQHERIRLQEIHGEHNVWNTDQVRQTFHVLSFAAPFCSVMRKSDNVKGWLEFQASPRLYFNFLPK